MATSVLKKITAEAKLLQKQNPKLKWTNAIKKASEFYRGTIKPVAKKTYKKAKAVAKASSKGLAVARRSYAKNMADIGRVQLKKANYHPRDERYIILVNGKPHLNGEPFFKETAVQIAEALRKVQKKRKLKEPGTKSKVGATKSNNKKTSNIDYTIFLGEITSSAGNKWKVYQKDITPRKGSYITYDWRIVRAKDSLLLPNVNLPEEVSLYHFNQNKDYITNLIDQKEATIGGVKKIAFKRTGKGGSKLGNLKKVGKPEIKPIKPTFAILNKQNPAFLSSLVDHSTKPKKKILVYSPLLNKYIIVVQYIDMYVVYIVSPAQTIRYSEVFRVVGTNKATLDRINKKYDIDLIP